MEALLCTCHQSVLADAQKRLKTESPTLAALLLLLRSLGYDVHDQSYDKSKLELVHVYGANHASRGRHLIFLALSSCQGELSWASHCEGPKKKRKRKRGRLFRKAA